MAQKKMILDLDTGIDDALAIAYALGSEEVDLIGITGTYGNVLVEQGVRNSLAMLDLFGRPDVPVFTGIPHARTADSFKVLEVSSFIHGVNGIGEVEIPASNRAPEARDAIDFIIESVHTYGKDLYYVPTGPLTNLAAAIERDPSIQDEIGRVVFMGGALTVCGNVSAFAEANISQDPEAADLVFKSHIPMTMVGLDVTLQTLLTRSETARWHALGTPAGTALADMTDYYIKALETTSPYLTGCSLHDPLAVAVAVDPTLVSVLPINLQCDVEGPSRGRTIGDNARLNDARKSTDVCVTVEVDRFLHEFMERVTSLAQRA